MPIYRPFQNPWKRPVTTFRNAASFGVGFWRSIDAANSGVTTPDHASLDILGDIDIRVLVDSALSWSSNVDFTLIAKRETAGGSGQSYKLQHFQTGGNNFLRFSWNINTTTAIDVNSTVETDSLTGPVWIRVTLDVDNGASGNDVKFYTSTDPVTTAPASVSWSQFGATVTTAGVTSIQNTTSPVTLGAFDLDDGGNTSRFLGQFYYAEIRNGIDGTTVGDPDFRYRTDYTTGSTLTDSTGKVWTIQSPAWWVLPLQGAEPAAGGPATVTPAVIAATAALPLPSVLAAATVAPTVVAAVAALPTPTILAAAKVTPTVVAVTVTLPTPTVLAAATVTPTTVSAAASLPTPSVLAAALVTPATVAAVAALPTPTIRVDIVATPAVVAATATLPTPLILAAVSVTPTTVTAAATLPTPTLLTAATVTPVTVETIGVLPTPTIVAASVVTPATVAALATLPTPTVLAAALVEPAVIPLAVALPTPTVIAGAGTTVQPDVVAVVTTLPTPTIDAVILVFQLPFSVTSNDGWDTGPLAGQNLITYMSSDDDDYITVTV